MNPDYDLLDAINRREIRTASDVAETLGVDETDALRRLHDAQSRGFVVIGTDLTDGHPDEGQVWRLTETGRREWVLLDPDAGP